MHLEPESRRDVFLTAVGETIAWTQAQREWRTRVRAEAREERVRARRLRDRAVVSRETLLAARWKMWSLGILDGPPATFPASWSEPRDAETALRLAARESRQLASQVGDREPVVRALCEVTDERLRRGDDEADLVLGLTARMLDLKEQELDGDDAETVLLASACRRCAETCRRALVALFLERE